MSKMPTDHISHTQVSMYLNCGEKYRRRYELGEKRPPGIALIGGKSVHSGAELNNRHKLVEHESLPVSDLKDCVATNFDAEISDGWNKNDGDDAGKSKDIAVKHIELFHRDLAPTIQPVMVEQRVEVAIPGRELNMLGFIDVIDDKQCVRDLKTSGKKKSQSEVDASDQLTFYALAYRARVGEWPKSLMIDNLVCTAAGNHSYAAFSTERSVPQINAYLAKLDVVIKSIAAGIFVPHTKADRNALCSSKYCGYSKDCPYYVE